MDSPCLRLLRRFRHDKSVSLRWIVLYFTRTHMNRSRPQSPDLSPLRAGEIAASARVAKLPSPVAVSAPICRIATFHSASLDGLVASLPALVALRESFPGARICSWARANVLPILENFGAVDEAHARPGGGLSSQAALMARLHAGHFDIALCFSRGSNAVMLTWATGANIRAGFVPSGFEAFLTHRLEKDGPITRGDALELAREVGARPRGTNARQYLLLPAESDARALKLARGGGIETPFVLVCPRPLRRRAPKAETLATRAKWDEAIEQMARSWPLVITPRPRAESALSGACPILQARGKLDVLTLAALMNRARGILSDDAGATALADLLERPVQNAHNLADAPADALRRFGV